MADYVDPTLTQQGIDSMNSKAQMAYYTSKLQGDSDTLAFQKAQAAVALAGNLSTAFGYAPGWRLVHLRCGRSHHSRRRDADAVDAEHARRSAARSLATPA